MESNNGLNWSEEAFARIQSEIHDQFNRIATVRRVLTPKMTAQDASTVPSNKFREDGGVLSSGEGEVEKIYEIGVKIGMTASQVKNFEEGDLTASILAARAAVKAAFAEDLVALTGGLNSGGLKDLVTLKSGAPSLGLLDAAVATLTVQPRGTGPLAYGENTYNAIVEAISELIRSGENGPYAGIFSFETFADMNKALPDRLDTTYDVTKEVLTEGIYSSGAMPERTALIFSVGGHTCDLFIHKDFALRFNFIDDGGNYRFEVFGREALTIREPDALVRLNFEPSANVASVKKK